ncbi:MAG TPA: response regulator [Chloroflexi bacterium]|nr:response regulator [Chloroflexota bacterium]
MPDHDIPHKPVTWMIVEDDAAIRNVILTMCELWEFQTVVFEDGFQAMEYLRDENPPPPLPDIALIDIRIPGPAGHEIGAMIREHPVLKNIGVILMTAYELPGSEEERYLAMSGADHLIYKPLPAMDELFNLSNEVIAKRRAKNTP